MQKPPKNTGIVSNVFRGSSFVHLNLPVSTNWTEKIEFLKFSESQNSSTLHKFSDMIFDMFTLIWYFF